MNTALNPPDQGQETTAVAQFSWAPVLVCPVNKMGSTFVHGWKKKKKPPKKTTHKV
jgi:hypothetical protein